MAGSLTQQTDIITPAPEADAAPKAEQSPGAGGPPAPKKSAKRRKKKKLVRRIVALVIVLAVLGAIGWTVLRFLFSEDAEQGDLMTATADYGSIRSMVQGSGVARAGESAAITLSASGTVQDVYVTIGQEVYEGDRLYTIFSPAAQEAVTAAENNVRAAEDAVLDAQEGVVSAQEAITTAQEAVTAAEEGVEDAQKRVGEAEKAVTTAERGVTEAEEVVAEAQAALEDRRRELQELRGSTSGLTVTAPFSGKIVSVEDIAVGDELDARTPVMTLVNDKTMKLSLYFSYAYEDKVYVGQSAAVSFPATMSTATGRVSAIDKVNWLSPEGASFFRVIVDVPNPGTLGEGTQASASMTAADGTAIYPYGSGSLTYAETRRIVTELPGTVTAVRAMQYQDVTAGQTLLVQSADKLNESIEAKQKEVRAAERAVETAEEGVESAKTAVENAKDGVQDAMKGVENARKGVENARKGVDQAVRGVEQAQRRVSDAEKGVLDAEAKVEEAQKALEDLDAVAPISGTVVSCTMNPGDEVRGGDTVMTISDTTRMVVDISVDDRNIGFVTPGMMVELSEWNGNMYMGAVTKIDMEPSSDGMGSGMTNYPVTLTVDNYDGTLLAGQWLQYSFVASQSDDCIVVPIQAVKSTMDEEGNEISVVFVQLPDRPENAVTMPDQSSDIRKTIPTEEEGFYAVPVVVGLSDTYSVEIREGLAAGDVVFNGYAVSGNGYYYY